MSRAACTPEQLDRIRDLARNCSDAEIGVALGFNAPKVQYIRRRHGIEAARNTWDAERIEAVRVAYAVEGLTARVVGSMFGVTDRSVRALACKYGWKRPRFFQFANVTAVNKAMARARPKPEKAGKPAPRKAIATTKPRAAVSRFLAQADSELIAAFVADRGVTVLPPGTAAGLSYFERELHAARPPASGLRDQADRWRARQKARAA